MDGHRVTSAHLEGVQEEDVCGGVQRPHSSRAGEGNAVVGADSPGNSCSVSLALLSSMPSTFAAAGGMATAVPARNPQLSDMHFKAYPHALMSDMQCL